MTPLALVVNTTGWLWAGKILTGSGLTSREGNALSQARVPSRILFSLSISYDVTGAHPHNPTPIGAKLSSPPYGGRKLRLLGEKIIVDAIGVANPPTLP